MTSQQDMRPQQRDDREDRKLGTQTPSAVSVHGAVENTLLDGLFLDLNQICSLEAHPALVALGTEEADELKELKRLMR